MLGTSIAVYFVAGIVTIVSLFLLKKVLGFVGAGLGIVAVAMVVVGIALINNGGSALDIKLFRAIITAAGYFTGEIELERGPGFISQVFALIAGIIGAIIAIVGGIC